MCPLQSNTAVAIGCFDDGSPSWVICHAPFLVPALFDDDEDRDLDEAGGAELEDAEQQVADRATAAQTIPELAAPASATSTVLKALHSRS